MNSSNSVGWHGDGEIPPFHKMFLLVEYKPEIYRMIYLGSDDDLILVIVSQFHLFPHKNQTRLITRPECFRSN